MIDLSRMKGIRVDPAHRTARAEPGLTWGEFDRETQAFGLATTGGVVSTTGIAGLTLGRGIGWLGRTHGLSCDNLVSVDIVTADGQLRTASAEENTDLFWAVRGGGGNFGVVTSFEYRLHQVGPTVFGGLLIWPRPMARDVLRLFREFTQSAPENASAYAALGTSPDGVPVVVLVAFCHGSIADAEALFQPLRAFGPPVADMLQPMPYTAVQQMLDALNPPGNRVYWKSAVLPPIDDDILGAIIDNAASSPSPLSAAILEFYGGAINRVAVHDTAYPLRDATYALNAVSMWTDPMQPTFAGPVSCGRRCSRSRQEASTSISSVLAMKAKTALKRRTGRTMSAWRRSKRSTTRPTFSATTRTSGRLAKSPQRLGSRADPAHVRPPEFSLQRPACGSAYEPTGVT
jgi:hypothetical protein